MELTSLNNLMYISVINKGTPILALDFLENENKLYKTIISEYFSTMSAFIEMFSNHSTFFIESGDIEISYESIDGISIMYAAHRISQDLRAKIQLYLDIIKNQFTKREIKSFELRQLQQCAKDLFENA